MSALAIKEPLRDLVGEAATACLEMSFGDAVKASKALEEKVLRDKALKSALLEPLIQYACAQAVGNLVRKNRDRIWNPPMRIVAASQSDRVMALANGTLMMFPLPGGKQLSAATRSDIAEAAAFYESQGKDMLHKARWLQLIGQSIPEGKKVGSVLDEKRLAELKAEAGRQE